MDRDCIDARGVQQREQGTARHAEAEAVARVVGIAHVHDHPRGCVLAVQPLDPRAAFDGRVVQAKRAHDTEPGRLQQEAGADRLELGAALEHLDRVARAREENRSGLAGGAVTDDGDLHRTPLGSAHCSGRLRTSEMRFPCVCSPLPLAGEGRVRAAWFEVPLKHRSKRSTPKSLTRAFGAASPASGRGDSNWPRPCDRG